MRKRYFLVLALILNATVLLAGVSKKERDILLDFYRTTQGDQWTVNWDFSKPVATWHGVEVRRDKVVSLLLFNNNLGGSLPSSLGGLKHLEVLNLAFNHIGGDIPQSMGSLRHLKVLRLGKNKFTGSIPVTIGDLSRLEVLDMFSNELSGKIPGDLGKLKRMKWLYLSHNQLKGTLPRELGHMESLERLEMAGNQLSGTIPQEIGKLRNLRTLILAENQFSGAVPQAILSLPQLVQLQLQLNFLDTLSLKTSNSATHQLALWDFDGNGQEYGKRRDYKKFHPGRDIRMADTKFEDMDD